MITRLLCRTRYQNKYDNSPALQDSLPSLAEADKRSRKAECSEPASLQLQLGLCPCCNMKHWTRALEYKIPPAQHCRLSSASHAHRALLSDFVIVCQRSRPLGTRERSSRYHHGWRLPAASRFFL